MILIFIYCIVIFFNFEHNQKQVKPLKVTVCEIYTVMPGDTIWSIATRYKHDDIRRLVYDIEKASNTTAAIAVGQELKIPLVVNK